MVRQWKDYGRICEDTQEWQRKWDHHIELIFCVVLWSSMACRQKRNWVHVCVCIFQRYMHSWIFVASLLLVRLDRALKIKLVSEETLHELMPALLRGNTLYFGNCMHLSWHICTEKEQKHDIERWLAEEAASCGYNPAPTFSKSITY